MKLARSHLGSLIGILAILGGITAAACSSPPAGPIGGQGEDDDNGNGSSTSPTQPSNNNNNATPGSQNGTGNGTGTGTGTGTTPTPPSIDASTTPPTTPTTPPASAATCGQKADMFACFDCCDAAHPGGWEVAAQAWDTCMCTQACAAACGSNFCAGGEPTEACFNCMDADQTGGAAADAACAANASCAAADACAQGAACDTKPEQ
jgi:hypothetical protein